MASFKPTEKAIKPRPVHGEGVTFVEYESGGRIISGGENCCANVFENIKDENVHTMDDNPSPITDIDVKSNVLLTACEDNILRSFNLSRKEDKFDAIVARFASPLRACALNSTATVCAAGGEDMVIKVVSFSDMLAKELGGHDGTVRSLSFDPQMEFLASGGEDGYIKLWNLASSQCVEELAVFPSVRGADVQTHGMYAQSFSNSGSMLAVAAGKSIQLYDRALEFKFELKELGHEKVVSALTWSSDDQYIASADVGGTILVWEIASRQSLARHRHKDAGVTSLAWHPREEEIAFADLLGQLAVWPKPVADSIKAKLTPAEEAAQEQHAKERAAVHDVAHLFDDDEDDGPKKVLKRRRKPAAALMDSDDEDACDGVETTAVENDDFIVADGEAEYAPLTHYEQPPFQPAATPMEQSRRFLAWNNVGVITSREEETTNAIDVEFHDAGKHRPIRYVDHFGFSMGSVCESCFALAAQSHTPDQHDSRDHPSVLFCRSLDLWASDDTWQVFFPPGEEIEAIAAGAGETSYVAAATNKRYVRLYSGTGVATHIFCIDGNIVSMVAHEQYLMVVYHSGVGANGDQKLSALLLDVESKKVVAHAALPLTPASHLTWVGFSDTGLPAMMDSEEVMRVWVKEWSMTWTPIAEFKNTKTDKQKDQVFWPVSLSGSQLCYVPCRGGETYPKVMPKPVVAFVDLLVPVVSAVDTARHEEAYIRSSITLNHAIEAEGLDELVPEDMKVILEQRRQLDKHLLAAISRCVQGSKAARALDLATQLLVPSSVDIAVKLAVKAKMPQLAERMVLAKQALTVSIRKQRSLLRQQKLGGMGTPLARTPVRPTHQPRLPPAAEVHEQEEEEEEEDFEMEAPAPTPTPAPMLVEQNQKPARPRVRGVNPFAKRSKSKAERQDDSSPKKVKAEQPPSPPETPVTPEETSKKTQFETQFETPKKTSTETSEEIQEEAKQGSKGAQQGKTKAKPFVNWLKAERKNISKANPGLSSKELGKLAKEMWAALSADDKAKWKL